MTSIRKRGHSYQAQVRLSGGRSASATFKTQSEARMWMREKAAELQSLSARRDHRITLCDVIRRFREDKAHTRHSGKIESLRLNSILRHPISSIPIVRITSADIAAYRDQRLIDVAANTFVREFGLIRSIIQMSIDEWGYDIPNPFANFRLKRKPDQRSRRISQEEFDILMATPCGSSYTKHAARFAIETAMRLGEILSLTWDDIDLAEGFANIKSSKNGYSRSVPLTPKAMETLCSLDRHTEHVFPVKPDSLKLSWRRLVKRSQIKDLRFHDLRHEAISRLLEKGLTLPEAASVSGHRTASMLLRYAHPDPRLVRNKMIGNKVPYSVIETP